MFLALKKKNVGETPPTTQDRNSTSKTNQRGNVVQLSISYAQKIRGAPLKQQEDNPALTTLNNQYSNKLEEMIMQLIRKMDSMFNLLSAMIAKMP